MPGINITRATSPNRLPLTALRTLIEEEIDSVKNSFFGKADLEGLKIRLLYRIMELAVKDA